MAADGAGPGKNLDDLLGIFSAATEGLVCQIRLCIQRDAACVHRLDEEAASVLHVAALHGHSDVVQLLLESGADVNEHTCGSLPLHLAAARGHCAAVQQLLLAGSWVSPREGSTAHRDTPLHKACRHGRLDAAALLLEAGAHPFIVNARGDTPLQVAMTPPLQALCRGATLLSGGGGVANSTEPQDLPPPSACNTALVDVKLQAAAFESAAGKAPAPAQLEAPGSTATGMDAAQTMQGTATMGKATDGVSPHTDARAGKVSLFGVLR